MLKYAHTIHGNAQTHSHGPVSIHFLAGKLGKKTRNNNMYDSVVNYRRYTFIPSVSKPFTPTEGKIIISVHLIKCGHKNNLLAFDVGCEVFLCILAQVIGQ